MNNNNFHACVFYGIPSLHNCNLPVSLRPVVSQCGSLLVILSIYGDFKLQKLRDNVQSCIHNSYTLILKLLKIGQVPKPHATFYIRCYLYVYTHRSNQRNRRNRKYLTYFSPEFNAKQRKIILDLPSPCLSVSKEVKFI